MTFLRAVSSDLATNNIEFDFTHQHDRCLAHIINLTTQQVLKTFNATASISENEFELLYNNNDNMIIESSIKFDDKNIKTIF